MTSVFAPLFGGDEPVFAATDRHVAEYLSALGVSVVDVNTLSVDPPLNLVFVISSLEFMRQSAPAIRERLANTRTLMVPTFGFDPSTEAAIYTVDALLQSNFADSVHMCHRWCEILEGLSYPLKFVNKTYPDHSVECTLLADMPMRANMRDNVELEPGEWTTPARYFEVSLEIFSYGPGAFRLDGSLPLTGMLAGRSSEEFSAADERATRAIEIVRRIGESESPLFLEIEDNYPLRLVGSRDGAGLEDILELIRPGCEDNLVEFSIGTNAQAADFVKPIINSQINEGIAGLHVGVGDGVRGMHIDLLSADTMLVA